MSEPFPPRLLSSDIDQIVDQEAAVEALQTLVNAFSRNPSSPDTNDLGVALNRALAALNLPKDYPSKVISWEKSFYEAPQAHDGYWFVERRDGNGADQEAYTVAGDSENPLTEIEATTISARYTSGLAVYQKKNLWRYAPLNHDHNILTTQASIPMTLSNCLAALDQHYGPADIG